MSPGLKSASISSSLPLIKRDLDFPRRTQLCHQLSTRLTPWRFFSHTRASAVFGAGLPHSLNLRDHVSQGSSLPPLEAETLAGGLARRLAFSFPLTRVRSSQETRVSGRGGGPAPASASELLQPRPGFPGAADARFRHQIHLALFRNEVQEGSYCARLVSCRP